MEATIYRALFLNEITDLDINSVGNHWSFDENVDSLIRNKSLSIEKTGKYVHVLRATVAKSAINWDATLKSNADYSHEFECVLFTENEIVVEYLNDDKEWIELGACNTGKRIDSWVDSCESSSEEETNEFINSLSDWAKIY